MSEPTPKAGRRMLLFLSETALAAREDSGERLERVAAEAGLSTNSIRNFERGETWPQNIDGVIAAYGTVAGLDSLALWQAALDLWREHGSSPLTGRREDGRATDRALEIVREQVRRSLAASPPESAAEPSAIPNRKAGRGGVR